MSSVDFQKAHNSSDLDFEHNSQHHTLGKGPTQASPGNHTHAELATLDSRLDTAEVDIAALEVADVALDARVDALETTDTSLDTRLDSLEAKFIPHAQSAGTINVTLTAAASGNAPITFPTGRFAVAPFVICSLANAPGGSNKLVPRAINKTTTGCSIYVYTGDGTTTTVTVAVEWHAIQMTSTTAAE